MGNEEEGAEGEQLFLPLEPGVAEADEDSERDDTERSDCAEKRGRVRNAG